MKGKMVKVLSPLAVITLIGSVFSNVKSGPVNVYTHRGERNVEISENIGKATRTTDSVVANVVSASVTEFLLPNLPSDLGGLDIDVFAFDDLSGLDFGVVNLVREFNADLYDALGNIYSISYEEIEDLCNRYTSIEAYFKSINADVRIFNKLVTLKMFLSKLVNYVYLEEGAIVNKFIKKCEELMNVDFDKEIAEEASRLFHEEYIENLAPIIIREEQRYKLDMAAAGLYNKLCKYNSAINYDMILSAVSEIKQFLDEAQEYSKEEILAKYQRALGYEFIVSFVEFADVRTRVIEVVDYAKLIKTELDTEELAVSYALKDLNSKYADTITYSSKDVEYCKQIVDNCFSLKYKKAFMSDISKIVNLANKMVNVRSRQSKELEAYLEKLDEFLNNPQYKAVDAIVASEGLLPFKTIAKAGHSDEFSAEVAAAENAIKAKNESFDKALDSANSFIRSVLSLSGSLDKKSHEEVNSEILSLLDAYWANIVPSFEFYPDIETSVYRNTTLSEAYLKLLKLQSIFSTHSSLFNTYNNYLLEEFGTIDYDYLTLDQLKMADARFNDLTRSVSDDYDKDFYKEVSNANKLIEDALARYSFNLDACELYVSQINSILNKENNGRVNFYAQWGSRELKEYSIYQLKNIVEWFDEVKNPDLQGKVEEVKKANAELESYIKNAEALAFEFNSKVSVYKNDNAKAAQISEAEINDIYSAYKAFADVNVSIDISEKYNIDTNLEFADKLKANWETNNNKVIAIAEAVKALNEDAKDIDKYEAIHEELDTLSINVLNSDLKVELAKVEEQYSEFKGKLDHDTAIVKDLGKQYEELTTDYITSSELAKADELDKQYSEVKFVTTETRNEYEAKRAWIEDAKAQRNSDYNSITSAFDILNKGIDGRHCSMKDLDQYNEMIELVCNINAAYKKDFVNDQKVGKYYDEVCLQGYRNKYAMALTIYNNDKSMAAKYVSTIEAGLNKSTATADEINAYKQKYGEFANLDKNHKGDFAKTLLKKQSLAPYKEMYNNTVEAYKKEWQGLNDLYNDFWVSPIKAWSKVVDEYGHLKPEETARLIDVINEAQKTTKRTDIREEYEKIYITLLTKFAPDPTFDLSVVFGGSEPYGECPVSLI